MLETWIDQWGDGAVLAAAGAVTGVLFGAMAQHSKFCLRAATVEVAEARFGARLSIWLIAFTAAVFAVQAAIATGFLDVSQARPLAATGSMSGAIIGGLMFGCGMILARGCASRLLILSATGNLRALITGLVLTLVAQASLRGALSQIGVGAPLAAVLAGAGLVAALVLSRKRLVPTSEALAGAGVGVAVGLGYILTYAIAQTSFEPIAISSVTFTGPSTDTLMGLVNEAELPWGFGLGLVPGVFAGAAGMALLRGEARIQRFGPDTPMERYLVGAVLMGFGSMLAGGCAVGAGMSGGSIFAVTAWVALFCMWIGAMVTHLLLLRPAVVSRAAT